MTWFITLLLAIDLTGIKTEPMPEKRSALALQYADSEINLARDFYNSGEYEKSQEAIRAVGEAVDLSYKSLMSTGKDPRKHSSHFKFAEKATRELLRRIEGLRELMGGGDRAALEPVATKVADVHESLLSGIMSGGNKQ